MSLPGKNKAILTMAVILLLLVCHFVICISMTLHSPWSVSKSESIHSVTFHKNESTSHLAQRLFLHQTGLAVNRE